MTNGNQRKAPSLLDRYELEQGTVFLTGTQALIRLMVDQKRADERAGLRTGIFVTGYPGSPLGGIDGALRSAGPLLKKYDIHHRPAQNEELAATSLMGTQMLDEHPHSAYDGVIGFWYGKGPGVDRSTDAMKHGNFAGTSQFGAVVILCGEDHEAKSSSVPYQQEWSFEHIGVPVLYPATVAEFIEFGRHAVALSRYSGCWVSLKLVGPLCDGGQTIQLRPDITEFRLPALEVDGQPFRKTANFRFFPVLNIATERTLYYDRHAAVRAYARENKLDRIVVRAERDRVGIVAAGKSYTDVRQALGELGFDEQGLRESGIRLLKIGLLCPMEPQIVREFAQGLEEIIVVEEKRDFLERQIGRILCDPEFRVRILGKSDREGRPLFPVHGGMDGDLVAQLLGKVLGERVRLPQATDSRLNAIAEARNRPVVDNPKRTPNYCSGCPHNIGTRLAPGQVAWGSPGCHIFAALMSEPTRRIEAVTQYGGEGMPWIGLAPFTDRKYVVQNVGDGSLFHSSYLNIRYAVTAGVSMTFKILYNGAIANTGGQTPVSVRSIPQLVTLLAVEGVARIAVVTKERQAYSTKAWPAIAELHEPSEMEETLKQFEATKGVTVLIYDGQCANERRRQQKRGTVPFPNSFTIVNEEVCENCGHCGEVANCMSLQKVETEFGRKTRIHQSSCNQDKACLEGECPSFVTVLTEPGKGVKRPAPSPIEDVIPEPALPSVDHPYHVYMPGLGGTGVITVNAILAQAATLDGKYASTYDQTGAAQKWGAVLSSLIITGGADAGVSNTVGLGNADLYLALDILAASDKSNLMRCEPGRTAAVINTSALPSGEMIRNVRFLATPERMVEAISRVTVPERTVALDAFAAAEALFGDYMMSNMIAIGAAYQAGLLPISAGAIEQAIHLNDVAVPRNILAFRAGRVAIHDPARFEKLTKRPAPLLADRVAEMESNPSAVSSAPWERLITPLAVDAESRRVILIRVKDLCHYQNERYATRYVEVVRRVSECEGKIGNIAAMTLTRAVARNLHKLMAYKDEYEVARLLTQETFLRNARNMFDGKVRLYFNLLPPILAKFGLKRKLPFGAWSMPLFRLLSAMRGLRGTALDPFRFALVRREERRLIGWYIDLVDRMLPLLTGPNVSFAEKIAELPGDIRGYDSLKLSSAATVEKQAELLLGQMKERQGARSEGLREQAAV